MLNPAILRRRRFGGNHNLVTGGDFSNPSDWTVSGTFEVTGGSLTLFSDGTIADAKQNFAENYVGGATYRITFEITEYIAGQITITDFSGAQVMWANALGAGTLGENTNTFTGNALRSGIRLVRSGAVNAKIDNLSIVKE